MWDGQRSVALSVGKANRAKSSVGHDPPRRISKMGVATKERKCRVVAGCPCVVKEAVSNWRGRTGVSEKEEQEEADQGNQIENERSKDSSPAEE